jgi:hypothetical protein
MRVRRFSFYGEQSRGPTSKTRTRFCILHVPAPAIAHHRKLFYTMCRLLHMPFCDGIVGLARDNTAHLFNEKTLGCLPALIQFFNRFFIIQPNNNHCSYIRQLPLWPERTQPRYIMNACEVEGGRGFAFCESPTPEPAHSCCRCSLTARCLNFDFVFLH